MLNDKVANLIKMYQELKRENESLRHQLVASQAQNESLMSKMNVIEEDNSTKDSEIDSILEKLNDIGTHHHNENHQDNSGVESVDDDNHTEDDGYKKSRLIYDNGVIFLNGHL